MTDGRFVPPGPPMLPPPPNSGGYALDVPPSSEGKIHHHTSGVDRAIGHTIAMTPISIMAAVLATIVYLSFGASLLTLATMLVFWASFTLVYFGCWVLNLCLSAESVMLYECMAKWREVGDARRERWAYTAEAYGLKHFARPWYEVVHPVVLVVLCAALTVCFLAACVVALLLWG